jgi:hypothetical protein
MQEEYNNEYSVADVQSHYVIASLDSATISMGCMKQTGCSTNQLIHNTRINA